VKIILASSSPYRKQLLQQLNLKFITVRPLADEDSLKKTAQVSLPDLPLFLAQKKAESLISQYPQDVIIGCDQMGLLNNTPLNKAGSKDKAINQLKSLQGKTHILLTAVAVYFQGKWHHHVDTTLLTMRTLSDEQIKNYVDLENPIDCAGSYKIEGLGVSLFEHVKTNDPSAIIGLPLMALTLILEKLSIKVI
jgi:septum formation protein